MGVAPTPYTGGKYGDGEMLSVAQARDGPPSCMPVQASRPLHADSSVIFRLAMKFWELASAGKSFKSSSLEKATRAHGPHLAPYLFAAWANLSRDLLFLNSLNCHPWLASPIACLALPAKAQALGNFIATGTAV